MTFNDVLLFVTAGLSVTFVLIAWKLGKERLYSAIIVFLILIAAVGGKTVEFFGFETNTGNVFFASVFLATYFLIERYGTREGIRSILVGIIGVVFFTGLARLTIALVGSPSTEVVNEAIPVAFAPVVRVAFASLLAYTVSQLLNVHLYIYLKQRLHGHYFWLRANVTNVCAQIVDSAVFFVVAFWGVVLPQNIGEIILTGFVIKVVFIMLASPLLILNRVEEEVSAEGASIAVR